MGDLFLSGDSGGHLFLHEVSASGLEAQAAINVNETSPDEAYSSSNSTPTDGFSPPMTGATSTPIGAGTTPSGATSSSIGASASLSDINVTPFENANGEEERKKVVDLDFWEGRLFTLTGDNIIRVSFFFWAGGFLGKSWPALVSPFIKLKKNGKTKTYE